jgi:O-antigen/teichoic acid export membrane protein
MQFGAWATLSAVLAWFYAWMDALVVGRFLGANDMGIYRTASTLVTMLFGLAFAPLLPVLYSVLSRAGHDVAATGRSLLRFSDAVTFVALPMAAVIALCGPWIEVVAFGPAWAGMGLVIALLAAGQGLAWTVGANGEAYRAIGKPKLEAMAMVLSSLAYLAGYLVSVQHGLMAFVMTRVLLVAVGIGIQVGIARHSFGIRIREWLAILTLPAASSGLAYAAAVLAPLSELDGAAETLARIAVLLSVLGIMVAAWGRERWGRIRRLLHVA